MCLSYHHFILDFAELIALLPPDVQALALQLNTETRLLQQDLQELDKVKREVADKMKELQDRSKLLVVNSLALEAIAHIHSERTNELAAAIRFQFAPEPQENN